MSESASSSPSPSPSPPLQPVIMVCHGGGPLPVIGDPDHRELTKSLSTRVPELLGILPSSSSTNNTAAPITPPKAIIIVTAHWTESRPHISSASHHDLDFDFSGFPPETYNLKYDAPGSPEVAKEAYELMKNAGLNPVLDGKRGWDHGVFIPLLLISPAAKIPIIQISVLRSNNPADHYAMGVALAPLRSKGIAILGSGMPTFHNLRLLFSGLSSSPAYVQRNLEWSYRLTQTLKIADTEKRGKELLGWRDWVGAKEAHPERGQEHFLPLLVCAGAGGDTPAKGWEDTVMQMPQWTYYWN